MEHEYTIEVHEERKRPVTSLFNQKQFLPIAAILGAVFLWGGSFASMRVVVGVFNPWSVMWIRMVIALVLLLPFAGKLKPTAYRKGDWKLLVPMVLFLPCFYFLLESYALRYTTSSQAGVIAASCPLLVALGAWIVLSESITKMTIAGLFLSMAGVIGLTLLGQKDSAAQNPLLGNALEILAMVSGAANMIIIKQLCERYNPWTLTALQTLAGAIFFLPGVVPLVQGDLLGLTSGVAANLVFLGTFVTLGAFGLYNWGMSKISATRASLFINLVPVTAVVFGWVFLSEKLNPAQTVSSIVVIVGVWLSQHAGEKA